MKKLFLTLSVVTTSITFANTVKIVDSYPIVQNTKEKSHILLLSPNTYLEIRYNKLLDTCYARVCKIVYIDKGDGTSIEVKKCSEWEEVKCPVKESHEKESRTY